MFARLMGLKTISPGDLHELVKNQAVTAIDVNSPRSYAQAHVPGALNLDPMSYGGADLPADKDAALVFYCSNFMCRKAPNAARRARVMGYSKSLVMSVGIKGWLAAKLPTQSAQEGARASAAQELAAHESAGQESGRHHSAD
ncbi:MAG: rhodanese-like domain-containing protein [Steroidobacteraceae bacterium]